MRFRFLGYFLMAIGLILVVWVISVIDLIPANNVVSISSGVPLDDDTRCWAVGGL